MSSNFFKKIRSIVQSNWFVTLFSTMFGVVFALLLTNTCERHTLNRGKAEAMQRVVEELEQNQARLTSYHRDLERGYNALTYLFSSLNDDNELIIPADQLEAFKEKTDSLVTIDSIIYLDNDRIEINGEMDYNFRSQLIVVSLSSVIWKSFKETAFLSITKFECITNLEFVYEFQEIVNQKNKQWATRFLGLEGFIGDIERRNSFFNLWAELLQTQKGLLEIYDDSRVIFESCSI